jgi:hypothetical protein
LVAPIAERVDELAHRPGDLQTVVKVGLGSAARLNTGKEVLPLVLIGAQAPGGRRKADGAYESGNGEDSFDELKAFISYIARRVQANTVQLSQHRQVKGLRDPPAADNPESDHLFDRSITSNVA